MAIKFKGGVILGADSRTTTGPIFFKIYAYTFQGPRLQTESQTN